MVAIDTSAFTHLLGSVPQVSFLADTGNAADAVKNDCGIVGGLSRGHARTVGKRGTRSEQSGLSEQSLDDAARHAGPSMVAEDACIIGGIIDTELAVLGGDVVDRGNVLIVGGEQFESLFGIFKKLLEAVGVGVTRDVHVHRGIVGGSPNVHTHQLARGSLATVVLKEVIHVEHPQGVSLALEAVAEHLVDCGIGRESHIVDSREELVDKLNRGVAVTVVVARETVLGSPAADSDFHETVVKVVADCVVGSHVPCRHFVGVRHQDVGTAENTVDSGGLFVEIVDVLDILNRGIKKVVTGCH